MFLGFTGTANGWTVPQARAVNVFLRGLAELEVFRHGDCVGADAQAHATVRALWRRARIVVHPPDNPTRRAFCAGDCILAVHPYLQRNRHIVDSSELLLATPKFMDEELRSGTWATVRYARKTKTPIVFCWPDGSTTRESK